MSQATQRKTASDTIHEMYLSTVKAFYLIVLASFIAGLSWAAYKVYQYFQNNSIAEISFDIFLLLFISSAIYSAYRIVKSEIKKRS